MKKINLIILILFILFLLINCQNYGYLKMINNTGDELNTQLILSRIHGRPLETFTNNYKLNNNETLSVKIKITLPNLPWPSFGADRAIFCYATNIFLNDFKIIQVWAKETETLSYLPEYGWLEIINNSSSTLYMVKYSNFCLNYNNYYEVRSNESYDNSTIISNIGYIKHYQTGAHPLQWRKKNEYQ